MLVYMVLEMEVKVPFSRRRDPESLIFSKDFVEIKQKVVHVIKEETIKNMLEKKPKIFPVF